MPRHSPFRIELTREERRALEARARKYTSPYRDVIRAKIVLLAADGLVQRRDRARAWIRRDRSSASGASASSTTASRASTRSRAAGAQPAFPPNVVVEVKRIACERPMDAACRWRAGRCRICAARCWPAALVATISGTTLWRWLDADAIRPWRHRSWIFPRDPQFAERAGPILDLYAGRWDGRPLGPHDYVISADEKTSIQARAPLPSRRRRSRPAAPLRVEHEYRAARCVGVSGRVGRPSRAPLRPLRDRATASPPSIAGRAGHDPGAVPLGPPRLLGHGQRLGASRRQRRRAAAGTLAHAASRCTRPARELAQPDRDLLLDRATQGPHAERFRHAWPRWSTICWRFNRATRPSRRRSAGPSRGADLHQLLARLAARSRCGRPHDQENTSP